MKVVSCHRSVRQLGQALLLAFVIVQCCSAVLSQPRRGDAAIPRSPKAPAAPRRGEAIIERKEESDLKVTVRTIREKILPNEGALVLLAVPGAQVTVTPQLKGRASKPRTFDFGPAKNTLELTALTPGKYQVQIQHEDYQPFAEVVTIARGEPTALFPTLVAKYGRLIIGDAPAGARVQLDGRDLAPARIEVDGQGRLVIARVPVGEHTLKLTKPDYDDWERKVEIKPGEPTPLTARLELATVALTVKAQPQAKLYLNGVERGAVPAEGAVTIAGLRPGSYRLDVTLNSYERHTEKLELTLAQRRVVKDISLVPVAASGEASDYFVNGLGQWSPAPARWRIETGSVRGLRVSGDEVALFKDATERRPANVYFDFKLGFDVRCLNGKGAAWIVRAQDLKNYYLFELTPAQAGRRAQLNFYVCRDGALGPKQSQPVPEDLNRPGDTFQILIEGRANKFSVALAAGRNPRAGEANPIGNFTDDTFEYGGIGFRAVNGLEMLVQSFVIIPQQRTSAGARR